MQANGWFPGCGITIHLDLNGVVRHRQDRERSIRWVRERRGSAIRQLRSGRAEALLIDREKIEFLMGDDT